MTRLEAAETLEKIIEEESLSQDAIYDLEILADWLRDEEERASIRTVLDALEQH